MLIYWYKIRLSVPLVCCRFPYSVTSLSNKADGSVVVIEHKKRVEYEHCLDPFA